TASTSLRFAVMHVTQTQLGADRLAPTQVLGFALSQNDLPLTKTNAYNLGWDQRIGGRTFLRAEAFRRNRSLPVSGDLCSLLNCSGPFDGGSVVLNHLLTPRWTMSPEYSVARSEDLFGMRHDRQLRATTVYVDPRRFSASFSAYYLDQHGMTLVE